MTKQLVFMILAAAIAIGLWGCEDTPPSEQAGTTARVVVYGFVADANTSLPVANALVSVVGTVFADSVRTDASGSYQMVFDLSGVTDRSATLQVTKPGYVTYTTPLMLITDTSLVVPFHVDRSTSATITGVVRDSVSLYPLRSVTVLMTLPGFADSVSTPKEGIFQLTADLVDRDSLPVALTFFKAGYTVKKMSAMLHKGQDLNLANILMGVDVGATVAQINGKVFDSRTNLPITNATVMLSSNILVDSAQTTFSGDYSFTIDLRGLSGVSANITVTKNGYYSKSDQFTVGTGEAVVGNFYLVRDTVTSIRDSSGTGLAHSIAFVGMTAREISVAGVGGIESTILTWEVHDSLGFPIDIDHADTVGFDLQGTPVSGGAYVTPIRAITNSSGRVATTVNSGTVAGVVQFVATLKRKSDGVIIRSLPVIITVNAGLPDQAHFSIGPAAFNFPGYDWIGHSDNITVQVGDRYSNPVKVGTAVYFNTTGGVVAASGFTDQTSHATVALYSGNPLPILPDLGSFPLLYGDGHGYTWVRAFTMGENSVNVTDSTLVLMSGVSGVYPDLTGISLNIPRSGCITIPVRISDEWGNPLSQGTTISVGVQFNPPPNTGYSVLASGLPEDPFTDMLIRGPGRTEFSLSICDGSLGGTPQRLPYTVTIRVVSPNGNVAFSMVGSVGN